MVSAEWTSPEYGRRTVNLGGTAGRISASRPNVDGSFYFRRVAVQNQVKLNSYFGGENVRQTKRDRTDSDGCA